MRIHVYNANRRQVGYADFGAGDLAFAETAARAYHAGAPIPALDSLDWEVDVHDARGRQVGTVYSDRNYTRLYNAEVVSQSSRWVGGTPVGSVQVVQDSVSLFRYDAALPGPKGNNVGILRFTGDLQGEIRQDPVYFYRTDHVVGYVQIDSSPHLYDRFFGKGNPLFISQVSHFRPSAFAGGAVLLLLLQELGG